MDNRIAMIDGKSSYILSDSQGKVQMRLEKIVGKGQNSIAYKAIMIVDGKEEGVCILKEYFPNEARNPYVHYKREKCGEPIRIEIEDPYNPMISEAEKTEFYQREILRQKANIEREIKSAKEFYFDGEENSPYVYRTDFFTRLGDSYYMSLDTSQGKTLKTIIQEEQKLSLGVAIQFCEELLVILKKLLDGEVKYVHGDIKTENIWIRGEAEASSMILLDMGSVFKMDDYVCKNFEELSEDAILKEADKIVANEGIGCSSEGYCAESLRDFYYRKMNYIDASELAELIPITPNVEEKQKAARELLEAIRRIDLSVDLYSVMQTLFYCATGEEYLGNGVYTVEKISELTGENESVCDWFLYMLKKNTESGYKSIEAFLEDLNALKTLVNKDADPRVLLQEIKKNLPNLQYIDSKLFGKIE